jgi:hypothetical protein
MLNPIVLAVNKRKTVHIVFSKCERKIQKYTQKQPNISKNKYLFFPPMMICL